MTKELGKKGEAIKIFGGKYKGKTGFYDTVNKATPQMFNVCVETEDGDVWTRVRKKFVKKEETPTNHSECDLSANPDVECKMEELAWLLAKCDLGSDGNIEKSKIREI